MTIVETLRKHSTIGMPAREQEVKLMPMILTSRAGCNDENEFEFRHDKNGNILSMPHMPEMNWDYANRLTSVF
jgi:hypothetical protein